MTAPGRRNTRNHHWAERIGEFLTPDTGIRNWWTDRQYLTDAMAKRANETNTACTLYVDDGQPTLMAVTVQRVARPVDE